MIKELKVDAIKEGTVIDHIPAGKVFSIVEILGIGEHDQVMIGTNLSSKRFGKKDVIKIENRILSQGEIASIALIAQNATISIIENFKSQKKFKVEIPDTIHSVIRCPNIHCITNEEAVKSRFGVESRKPLKVRCAYCERLFDSKVDQFILTKKSMKDLITS